MIDNSFKCDQVQDHSFSLWYTSDRCCIVCYKFCPDKPYYFLIYLSLIKHQKKFFIIILILQVSQQAFGVAYSQPVSVASNSVVPNQANYGVASAPVATQPLPNKQTAEDSSNLTEGKIIFCQLLTMQMLLNLFWKEQGKWLA